MYRSEYIVCFRSEISFVPLLFSHRTPFLRPYWQIYFNSTSNHNTLQNYHNAYGVVSYFNSTSNHNSPVRELSRRGVVSYFNSTSKITAPGNQLYTKLCNKYVANFTSLMRRENQQIQLMLILCYPVI